MIMSRRTDPIRRSEIEDICKGKTPLKTFGFSLAQVYCIIRP